jgi:hypothetical protein
VLALVVCEVCSALVGKVLRDNDGSVRANRMAPPQSNYAALKDDRGARVAAPPMVASGPVDGALFWCPKHGARGALDPQVVAALDDTPTRPKRLPL